ncbi:hypothetical protein [Mycobacterium kyogaense]|uniref:hypothetical protein n=1 Tax=Mycobacterium kyogaense TaxID=2212479 RepID=UPI0013C40D48|nr:hypothetical protein [Mycobacterium kyogaense]
MGDRAVLERVERSALPLENPCGAFEHIGVEARRLHDRALRGQRAVQDRDTAGGVDRVVHRPQHLAVRIRRLDVGQVLRHRLPGDGEAIPVQQAGIE